MERMAAARSTASVRSGPPLAASPGGPDDRVGAGKGPGELGDVSLLDGQDQWGGADGDDVVGLIRVADEGDDLVAGLHEQRCGQQRDLAVASDHDDTGHVRRPF